MSPVDIQNLYILIQLIGLIVLLAGLTIVLLQKPSDLQKQLIIIYLTLLFSFVAYILELNAPNVEVAYTGAMLGYIGKPFAFLTMFFLLCDYAKIRIAKIFKGLIVGYFVCLTLIVLSNQFHHLYYSVYWWKETVNNEAVVGSKLSVSHGPFWYVFMVSTFVIFFAYILIIIYEFKNSKTKQAKEMTFYLLGSVLFSIIGLALFISGITNGYETTLAGTVIGSICLLILFIRYRLFDSLTLAKDQTFDASINGVIIFDAKDTITYYNKVAQCFVPELSKTMGHREENIILNNLQKHFDGELLFFEDKVYIFRITDLKKKNGLTLGKNYVFFDITEQHTYQDKLNRDVIKATKKLKDIQTNILMSFANLIESRDGYTGLHIKNVSVYSRAIAEELRRTGHFTDIITDEYLDMLELTAPLHDVGKIKVSDTILGKKGHLTEEEFEMMKKHTIYGKEIVDETLRGVEDESNIKFTRDIALYHHERFDGTGYPIGLKGTEIPLSARIVAVADVYDALRMERPYKEPYTKEKSINIIKEETGTHFDPVIVEAFLNIVDNL